jgi:hypothetical protein
MIILRLSLFQEKVRGFASMYTFALWPRSPLWRQRLDFEQYDTLDEYFYVMIFNRSSGSKR